MASSAQDMTQIVIDPELEMDGEDAVEFGIFKDKDEEQEALSELAMWLDQELNRATASRYDQERVWVESLRMYEGVSKYRTRNTPIENAPNLEVGLGAIASDAIYAQIINLIFNVSPLITVREIGTKGKYKQHVKALQRFMETICDNQPDLREAAENALLDDVQLGTGIYYTRWSEKRKKTQVDTVTKFGPLVKAVPVEDFFVPGGAYSDLQETRWVSMRVWLTKHELKLRERDLGWNLESAQQSATIDRVRQARERLGRQTSWSHRKAASDPQGGDMYEIHHVWCLYDIDGDGIDEDLLVTYDRIGKCVLKWRFNPYDKRPFSVMRYQLRAFLFYGLGVVDMIRPYQEGATELYNHWVTNSMLANARFWVGKHGAVPKNQLRIWPNRFLPVSDPQNDLNAIPLADTYPSAPAALQTTISFAERRSGINDLTAPRPSSVLGSRTPGITALSMLQKANERFGPAFDGARLATADAARQKVYRYQERILAADGIAEEQIRRMLGDEDAELVLELLNDKDFDASVLIQLTASSANTNRETERQNSLLLLQTLLGYYERVLQLAQVVATPGMPPVVVETGKKVINAASEIVERTLRTFDQIRDPEAFIVNIEKELGEQLQGMPPQGMAGLEQALQQQQEEATGGIPGAPGAAATPFMG